MRLINEPSVKFQKMASDFLSKKYNLCIFLGIRSESDPSFMEYDSQEIKIPLGTFKTESEAITEARSKLKKLGFSDISEVAGDYTRFLLKTSKNLKIKPEKMVKNNFDDDDKSRYLNWSDFIKDAKKFADIR